MRAWRFEDLDPHVIAHQAGWKEGEAVKKLAALRKDHANPAWIDARLATLPVPSLAVLATLAEVGGVWSDDAVVDETSRTHGIARDLVVRSVGRLLAEVFVVSLRTGHDSTSLSLVAPSAEVLAARLRDADIPALPDAPFAASDRLDDGRALVAVCGALGHVEIKITQAGLAHRAGIKRLAKSIGLDEDTLDRLVSLGLDLGALAPTDDDVIRPVPRRLRELARGSLKHRPVVATFIERLRATGGPIQLRAVERWLAIASRTTIGAIPLAQSLGSIPGMCRGQVGEVDVLALAPLGGTAAATVTPSFEVFVPPESRHEHLVDVLTCAELVRCDRVVVGRITKATIQRASANGMTAAALLAGLAAASRTPVPQNVVAAIEDWAATKVAVTAAGRVIVVPPADEARVASLLAMHGARVLAPGVVVLDAQTSARVVTSALARIGIAVAASDARDLDDDRPDAKPQDDVVIEHLPPLRSGDPGIQRRFAAYKAGRADELAKVPHAPVGRRPAGDEELEELEELGGVPTSDRASMLVERWEDATRCVLDDELAGLMAAMLDAVPLDDQRFLLASKNARQLNKRLRDVVVERGGMAAFFAKNREAVNAIVGPELANAIATSLPKGLGGSVGTSAGAPAPESCEWLSTDLHARLSAAARVGATYTLDLGAGKTPTVRIRKVIARGTVVMVLGENIADESAIAVPLAAIARIAEPPSRDASSVERTAWRPLAGQPQPAGHLPCPCGSGERYRSCCRPKN